jgi:molybdenum cofactor cytidylyltransferase
MISAIVLAAGGSARFGGCKQLVRMSGKTLLDHVLDTLRTSTIHDVLVVLGAHADEIKRAVRFDRERIVMNPDHAGGISTSIHAALRALPDNTDAAMFVLADQPFVSAQTINTLAAEYERSKASLIVPTYKGARGNPVVAARSLFGEMMDINGDVGFRALFGKHAETIVKVPVDDVGIVTDIDTPQDLDRPRGLEP